MDRDKHILCERQALEPQGWTSGLHFASSDSKLAQNRRRRAQSWSSHSELPMINWSIQNKACFSDDDVAIAKSKSRGEHACGGSLEGSKKANQGWATSRSLFREKPTHILTLSAILAGYTLLCNPTTTTVKRYPLIFTECLLQQNLSNMLTTMPAGSYRD